MSKHETMWESWHTLNMLHILSRHFRNESCVNVDVDRNYFWQMSKLVHHCSDLKSATTCTMCTSIYNSHTYRMYRVHKFKKTILCFAYLRISYTSLYYIIVSSTQIWSNHHDHYMYHCMPGRSVLDPESVQQPGRGRGRHVILPSTRGRGPPFHRQQPGEMGKVVP